MDFAFWVRAVEIQLKRDVYPAWKYYLPLGEMPVVAYGDVSALAPNSTHTILVVDRIDDPGLGGYHSGIQAAGYAFGRALPKSTIISHEAVELVTDPFCNLWHFEAAKNRWVAREPGDPVERDTYEIEVELLGVRRLVTVSNFAYPRWFEMINHDDSGRFDHMDQCSAAFDNRGYIITRDSHHTVTNIYASHGGLTDANAKRADPHSRTSRRAG